MATIADRLKAAIEVYRYGYPPRYSWMTSEDEKAAPFVVWPEFKRGRAEWRMVNLEAYYQEGWTTNALIYSAVMYKAKASAVPPMIAYKGDPESAERLDMRHPLAKLIARPNPSQSWREYQMLQEIYLNMAGECFTWLQRKNSVAGVPSAMYTLNPARVQIVPEKSGKGKLGYIYVSEGQSERDAIALVPQDVIHTKFPNPVDTLDGDGYGFSPLSPLARSGDVDNMITEFLQQFFEKGAMVSGLLKFDNALDTTIVGEIRERWNEIYGGHKNWAERSVGVLDRGGEYERIALTFNEMGFTELDERNETRILAPFGVPPILIGSRVGLARSTYSNYQEARQAFWEDTMIAEIGLFQDDYQYFLQSDDGGFVAYDLDVVPALKETAVERSEMVGAAFTRGAVTRNEYRAAIGQDATDDGDVYLIPISLVPIPAGEDEMPDSSMVGAAEAEEDEREAGKSADPFVSSFTQAQKVLLWKGNDRVAQSWERKYRDASAKLFNKNKRDILAMVTNAKKEALRNKASVNWLQTDNDVKKYLSGESADTWRETFVPLVEGVVEDQGDRWSVALGTQFNVQNLEARDWFNQHTIPFAQEVNTTTERQISQILNQAQQDGSSIPQIQNQISALFDRYITGKLPTDDMQWFLDRTPPHRTEMIARTETIRASNAGSEQMFRDMGAKRKEWLSTIDDRTRTYGAGDSYDHLEPNGQVVGIDEPFIVSGEQLMYPVDPAGSAGNTINCRCTVLPVLDGKPAEEESDRPDISTVHRGQDVTEKEMYNKIEEEIGIRPNVKDYKVLSDNEFNDFAKQFDVFVDDIAAYNIDGYITVRAGYEDSALHEFIHSAGFMPDEIHPGINEGMTQALTQDIARILQIDARSGYTTEVDWVNDYLIPLTGEDRRELFKGYANSKHKQKYLAELIWEKHGSQFGDVAEWGTNVQSNFMRSAVNNPGYDVYLNYLVDEVGVLRKERAAVDRQKVIDAIWNGKPVRIIYITRQP